MSPSQKLTELRQQLGRILLGIETTIEHPLKADPPKEGERVIGVLNDPTARALLSFYDGVGEYVEDFMAANSLTSPADMRKLPIIEIEKLLEHVTSLTLVSNVAREFLWQIVYQELPEAAKPGLQCKVRADYQIVAEETEEDESGSDFPGFPGLSGVAVVEIVRRRRRSKD